MAKQIAIAALIIVLSLLALGFILLVYRVVLGIVRDKTMSWFDRLKWYVKEFIKCLSNEPSFFSIKRIQIATAFTVGQWGMVHWLIVQLTNDVCKLTIQDIGFWAGIEFALCGFTINKVQKEKIEEKPAGA